MEERRQHERYETNVDVKLRLQEKQIPCRIENLSQGGTLLQVDSGSIDALTPSCVGQETTFQLNNVQTKGTIVRFFESEGTKVLALRFRGQTTRDVADR